MTTTVNDLIARTQSHLFGSSRIEMNRVASNAGSGDTTITFEFDTKGLTAGSVIGIEEELVYVWSVNTSSKVATVQRGYRGSTAAAHVAGSVVEVNSRFPRYDILNALRDEVNSWGNRLWSVASVSITEADWRVRGYDLAGVPTNFLHVVDASIEPFVAATGEVSSASWPKIGFRVQRGMDTADFSSGSAIFVDPAVDAVRFSNVSRRVRLRYAVPFSTAAWTPTFDVEATGLMAASMTDIPPLGAAWRLLAARESTRTDSTAMGQSRRAEEVAAGEVVNLATSLKRLRDARIAEEMATLLHRYGIQGGF